MLHRGARFTEMLKQGQYDPLPMEKEVLIMLAGGAGYFDDLEIVQIRPFEKGLYSFFDAKYANLVGEIRDKKELSDELRGKLIKALDEYKAQFVAEHPKADDAKAAGAKAAS
jgi:F-type H+-transporting ATPase subunit alpha